MTKEEHIENCITKFKEFNNSKHYQGQHDVYLLHIRKRAWEEYIVAREEYLKYLWGETYKPIEKEPYL